MLSKRLLDSITSDLRLDKLRHSCKPEDYQCYCLYSAASLWAKAASQDSLETLSMGDKGHVVRSCNLFINRVIEGEIGGLVDYFRKGYAGDKDVNPGQEIVKSLVQTHELIQTIDPDDGRTIVSLPLDTTELHLSDGVSIIPGIIGADREYDFVSALSFIGLCDASQELNFINNTKWVENRIKEIKSKPIELKEIDRIRYYDPKNMSMGGFSSTKPLGIVPFEVASCQLDDYGYHFYLKIDNYFYEIVEDSPVINKESGTPKPKLYRRFTYYLDQVTENNNYLLKNVGDSLSVDLRRPLSQHEDSLIRRVMWPRNNINHQTKFIGFNCMESFIIELMENMGAEAQWVK